jgi:hypothetical protein
LTSGSTSALLLAINDVLSTMIGTSVAFVCCSAIAWAMSCAARMVTSPEDRILSVSARPGDPMVVELERTRRDGPRRIDQTHCGLHVDTKLHGSNGVIRLAKNSERVDEGGLIDTVEEQLKHGILAGPHVAAGEAPSDAGCVDQPGTRGRNHQMIEHVWTTLGRRVTEMVEHSVHGPH